MPTAGRVGMGSGRDLAGALRFAREAADRLPSWLRYHDAAHTFDVVLPAARRLAADEGLDPSTRVLVTVAAAFHDLGFLEAYDGHEAASVRLVREALPRFGFDAAAVDAVAAMIDATRLPQSPRSVAEQVLADADLSTLAAPGFLDYNQRLREELAARGTVMSDAAWYARQLAFLRAHRYFTRSARRRLGASEERNRERLAALLAEATGAGHADPPARREG